MVKRKAAADAVSDLNVPATAPRRSSRRRTEENSESQVGSNAKGNSTTEVVKPVQSKPRKPKQEKEEEEIKKVALKKEETDGETTTSDDSPKYWLMKAEPESRIEKGHDIKFSIDDLASKTEPEPWDGIRNYAARNNLRSMKKGDLAFFYHSSCKVPAIVGLMEIVQEHSPDLTAQDPKKPYYDPKDADPENPKWSVVHVEFRRKFKHPLTLHELKDLAKTNPALEKMDLLGKGRLSVGKVSKEEWDFIMEILEKREQEPDVKGEEDD